MPYRTIPLGLERLAISRLMLDMYATLNDGPLRVEPVDMLVMAALALGELEGWRMTVTKISSITRQPRPTVERHLRRLQACGALDKEGPRWCVKPDYWTNEEAQRTVKRIKKAIASAHLRMSKTGT